MIVRRCFLLVLVVCALSLSFIPAARSEAEDTAGRIARVENGLVPEPGIVIKGQTPEKATLQARMDYYSVPGISIAVINQNRIEWAKGYGLKESDGHDPVTPETLFQAASISKPVSSTAALSLVQKEVLDLDKDVNQYLRNWKVPDNEFTATNKVTLRSLLSHTAGLTVQGFAGYAKGAAVPSLKQVLDGEKPANSKPIRVDIPIGLQYRYSGGGYVVLQQLLMDVTGKPFPEFMRRAVLDPLGMVLSTYEQPLPSARLGQEAAGHRPGGHPVQGNWHTYPEQAAAGLWTTPSDLCRFALEIMAAWRGDRSRVLSSETVKKMLTVQKGEMGLGLVARKKGQDFYFTHGRSNEGFQCFLAAFPERGQGAVIMTNGDLGGTLLNEILRSVVLEYGWTSLLPRVKEPIPLDPESQKEYPGIYEFSPLGAVTITLEDGHFYADPLNFFPKGKGKVKIYPESASDFFAARTNVTLAFSRDAQGRIDGLVLTQGVFERKARKLGRLDFRTSDDRLAKAFDWAKRQALAYARVGDPVGEWYEAALPGRSAFCMRDASHQAAGANALGLASFNKNMLRRFARNISEAKDWCTYWEINSDDKPAPVDYRNDKEFWYNLPSNYDVLDAIWRQYRWTGDRSFLDDPVFQDFGERTVKDYTARWDLGLDKVMKRQALMNLALPLDPRDPYRASRGLPTYNEEETPDPNIGADLLAAQYAGYRAYAALQKQKGNDREAEAFLGRAAELKAFFHKVWWNKSAGAYNLVHFESGRFKTAVPLLEFLLYFDLTSGRKPTDGSLEKLLAVKEINIESRTYYPEVFYRYGRPEAALKTILELCDENTKRREYPKVSFAVIGALTRGLMGIEPDARDGSVATWPQLTSPVDWAEMGQVPVLNTFITVKHVGLKETSFLNSGQNAVTWKACFPGKASSILVGDREMPAQNLRTGDGREAACIVVKVEPGQSLTAVVR